MWLGIGALALGTLVATSVVHDVFGWSELQSLAVFVPGLVATVGAAGFVSVGSLRDLPVHTATLARFHELRRLGLAPATPADRAAASTGIDRLVDRITTLGADRPEIVSAVTAARRRAAELTEELGHLEVAAAHDAGLRERLVGVEERIQAEITGIRARLAEAYATLLELDAAGRDTPLPDALDRLWAELEVAGRPATGPRRPVVPESTP